jgi:hypothetical protein
MVNKKKIKLKDKPQKKNESILPYLLVFILFPVAFYFGLFQIGGWLGIIVGVALVFFLLSRKG